MITRNPMQLKAFIKKKAAEKNISAQLVMQNYMLERLLERISLSTYKNNFILKGGFLISVIVGLDTRTTMDLDTTIKGFTLTHESIRRIFQEGTACLRLFRALLWRAAWFCRNKAGHFFQQENRLKISPFCTKSSHVFRRFHRPDRFLRGDCQPFHQPPELLRR